MTWRAKQSLTDELDGAEEAAAAWFLRFCRGEAREDDPEYVAWLNESGAHADAMERVAIAWDAISDNAAEPEIVTARGDALARSAAANEARWLFWRRKQPISTVAGIAASLFAMIAVLAVIFTVRTPWRDGAEMRFATEIGETRVVTLSDNTKVSLDASSAISVRLTQELRIVQLTAGQAFFDVAKDTARPFQVAAGGRVVTATGTAFNVELVGEDVLVTLIEGEVVVSGGKEISDAEMSSFTASTQSLPAEHILSPGEQLLASREKPIAVARAADIEKTTAWRRGKLIFEDDPLPVAVERMNRYSRIRISVEDADIAGFGVSGVFNAGDTDAFVEALEAYFPVDARRMSRNAIELRSREE